MSATDVRRRMASQPSRADWLAAADLVVLNHGDVRQLEQTVELLGEFLLEG